MQKVNSRRYWKDFPSIDTQIDADILNKKDIALDTIDDRVIHLDITKLDKADAQGFIKSLTFNRDNGVFTITYFNGATDTIDTMLEKLAINFDYDYTSQKLLITLSDGEVKEVDLSALITQYEFSNSGTIAFAVDDGGKVSAEVIEGSIEEKHLRPDYLADIKVEAAKAEASKEAAAESEGNASKSANAAKSSEDIVVENALSAAESASTAAQAAEESAKSAEDAESAKTDAEINKDATEEFANTASAGASTATQKASEASGSASLAAQSAENASDYAMHAESFARGGTGTREGENSDNAQYYYEQAKRVIQGVSGIVPMGTISFEGLSDSNNQKQGYMFNISDSFVSDERFQDGGGIFYGVGSNVLYTADGKWDVLAGATVSGVKGNKETEYRQGFVNMTAENIGALPSDGTAQNSVKWNGKSVVFISENEYQNLEVKDDNTFYFRYKE